MTKNKSTAQEPYLGYLYQAIYALYILIEKAGKDPNASIAIEKFDDISFEAVKRHKSGFQIIILDHADLKDDWFQESVIERWRRGDALIPKDWSTN